MGWRPHRGLRTSRDSRAIQIGEVPPRPTQRILADREASDYRTAVVVRPPERPMVQRNEANPLSLGSRDMAARDVVDNSTRGNPSNRRPLLLGSRGAGAE